MNTRTNGEGGYVVLTGYVEPEDHLFVSYCPELDVASCGDSPEEALDNLGDALAVHLEALAEIGELERVLGKSQAREPGPEGEE